MMAEWTDDTGTPSSPDATTPLATRISEVETAIHTLATNKVAEYFINGKRFRYHDLEALRAYLTGLRGEQAATSGSRNLAGL